MEDIGGYRIYIVIAERLRRILRHGTADVVEQCRRIGPVASYSSHRLRRCQGALATDQSVANTAVALVAVTGRALLREDVFSMTDRTASRRQATSVPTDIDIPARDRRRRCGTSNAKG